MSGPLNGDGTLRWWSALLSALVSSLAIIGALGAMLVFWGNSYWADASEFKALKEKVDRIERKVDTATVLILQGQLADIEIQKTALEAKAPPLSPEDQRRLAELRIRAESVRRQLQQVILREDVRGAP